MIMLILVLFQFYKVRLERRGRRRKYYVVSRFQFYKVRLEQMCRLFDVLS